MNVLFKILFYVVFVKIHPATQAAFCATEPDFLNQSDIQKVQHRIARKAGYTQLGPNIFGQQSKNEKFQYFSSSARNMHHMARAYYESGHLLTAEIIREEYKLQKISNNSSIWDTFKTNKGVIKNFKRQDYINHRLHILKNNPNEKQKHNNISIFSTRMSRAFMGLCEFSAPIGFLYPAGRNALFHSISHFGLKNKAGTILAAFGIGVAVDYLIKTIRNSTESGGHGFNPLQMLSGTLLSFSSISSASGLLSFISCLISQAFLKNINPSEEQKEFIQFEMNSTLNKLNQLMRDSKSNHGKMHLLSKALSKKIPKPYFQYSKKHKEMLPLLVIEWINALEETPNASQECQLNIAKKVLGKYLSMNSKKEHDLEKHFSALAGMVEHFQVENISKSKNGKSINNKNEITPREYRMDAKQFSEEFAMEINRKILKLLIKPAKLLDKIFKNKASIEEKMRTISSKEYAVFKANRLKDPRFAHKNKFNTEYISSNIHQYGPMTRALIQASNQIHEFNYNYVLSINPQVSRIFNAAARWGQSNVLKQHPSRIVCNSLGRFLGDGATALLSYFGMSALIHITSESLSNNKASLSCLATGTLMALIGIPAFVLSVMAQGAALLEGWEGDIQKPMDPRKKYIHT